HSGHVCVHAKIQERTSRDREYHEYRLYLASDHAPQFCWTPLVGSQSGEQERCFHAVFLIFRSKLICHEWQSQSSLWFITSGSPVVYARNPMNIAGELSVSK
ncbi:MAG: hypothetical protein WCG29_14140, partial [Desulfomonile sp.]